jgi:cell division protein FtsB
MYLIDKYRNDNSWLVDKLAELNRENQDLESRLSKLNNGLVRKIAKSARSTGRESLASKVK